jgi:hypothetical protein
MVELRTTPFDFLLGVFEVVAAEQTHLPLSVYNPAKIYVGRP